MLQVQIPRSLHLAWPNPWKVTQRTVLPFRIKRVLKRLSWMTKRSYFIHPDESRNLGFNRWTYRSDCCCGRMGTHRLMEMWIILPRLPVKRVLLCLEERRQQFNQSNQRNYLGRDDVFKSLWSSSSCCFYGIIWWIESNSDTRSRCCISKPCASNWSGFIMC